MVPMRAVTLACLCALLAATAWAHSERHIHDGPNARPVEDDSHVDAAHSLSDPHLDEIFDDCEICRSMVVPAVTDAVAADADTDPKELIERTLGDIARHHTFDDRKVAKRDEPGDHDDRLHEYAQSLLFDEHASRSLFALVNVWRHFSPERRSHFGQLVEHVLCACPHDGLMDGPNARLHGYLEEYEAALQGALRTYGGHPEADPVLSSAPQDGDDTFQGDEDLPDAHADTHEFAHRGQGEETLQPHDHAPHSDSGHDEHGLHGDGAREPLDEF